MFDYNTYGADLNLFYPFKDERFSLEGRIGYVGFGYWLSLIHISINTATKRSIDPKGAR